MLNKKPVLIFATLLVAMVGNNAAAIEPPPRVGSVRERQHPAPPAVPLTQPGADADSAAREGDKVAPDARAKPGKHAQSNAGAPAGSKKPAQTSPKKVVRRSVYQIIDSVPRVQSPTVYGPVLGPPAGVQTMPSPVPPNPVILNGCNGGACTDQSGARYRGGVGSVLISPEGRACSSNGITVQCF